jgi:ABC-2 type transport system permease protein
VRPMFRVEWAKAVHRWRTYLLAAAFAGLPILIVIAIKLSPPGPTGSADAPPFLLQIVHNGLFAPLTGLAVIQPFFMSVAIGLFAGDAIAGEAQGGTLRSLLVSPVGRVRLVITKYVAAMSMVGSLLLDVVIFGTIAGGIVFGFGPLPTLSGSTLSPEAAALRILMAVGYILLAAAGVTAIGLFISTLTDSGPGAIVGTVIASIASQVLDNIPSLHAIHPFLPTHDWTGFVGLFRFPIAWQDMRNGLTVSAIYTAVFLGAALLMFSRKDVTS